MRSSKKGETGVGVWSPQTIKNANRKALIKQNFHCSFETVFQNFAVTSMEVE